MVYSTEAARWKAYQFSDPFASGSFYVCNKVNHFFCRPDCDARQVTNLRSEIIFVDSAEEANRLGYTPCEACSPIRLPQIDVKTLINCVSHVNAQIGFLSPLMDENEDVNNRKIKENILESMKARRDNMGNSDIAANRRASAPVLGYNGNSSRDYDSHTLSKNDSDHYRLVDLACRHLAFAAANNVFGPSSAYSPNEVSSPESPELGGSSAGKRKRKRRGGILGFKELAAKSKLSPWHFHRVFKSVTGLTPKNYGDRCYEYLKAGNLDQSDMQGNRSMAKDLHSSISRRSSRKRLSNGYMGGEEMSPRKKTKNGFPDDGYNIYGRTQSLDESSVSTTYSALSFPDLSRYSSISYDYSPYDDDSLSSSALNQRVHGSETAEVPNSSLQMVSQGFSLELNPSQPPVQQTYQLQAFPTDASYQFTKNLPSLNYRNSLIGQNLAASQRAADYNLTLHNNSQQDVTGPTIDSNSAVVNSNPNPVVAHTGEESQLQGFVDPFSHYYGTMAINQFNYSYNNGFVTPHTNANINSGNTANGVAGIGLQQTSGTLLALGSNGSAEQLNMMPNSAVANGEDIYKTGSENLQFELLPGYSNI